MNDREIVRLALYDAIDWQTSLADAYTTGDEKREALSMAKKYRTVLNRRYGLNKTPMEKLGDDSVSMSLDEIRAKFG
jgi:hypothetical protein